MVAIVSASTTVLSASSPYLVPGSEKDAKKKQAEPTTLTPGASNSAAANIAYSFSPAGSLELLSRPASSVLLTQQARQKPAILENRETSQGNEASFRKTSPQGAPETTRKPIPLADFSAAIKGFSAADKLSANPSDSASFDISA